MRKTILLFLLFLSVTAVRTLGQNITFSHLTTDDGLSQFSVNSLYIDERGIIWIGTREGLNRYNGNDIKSFKLKKNDPNSLFSNTVLRITGNKNGKVYLLCTDGVAEFDMTTQRFKTLLQGNVDAIYYNEKLYIGKREEVFVFNENTNNFDLYYHLAGKDINLSCLHLDEKKNLWMGTTSNGVYCLSDDKQLSQPITRKHSQHLRRLIQRTVDWQLGRRTLPYPHKRHYRQLPPRPEESEQYMFRFCQKLL